jgi:hypothetical protein
MKKLLHISRLWWSLMMVFVIATPSFRPVSGVAPQQQSKETGWVVWETGVPIQRLSLENNALWVGGYKGGLFRWTLDGGPLAEVSTANGLPGNDVLAHASDGSGGRWVR